MITDLLLMGAGLLGQWSLGIAIAMLIAGPRLLAVPKYRIGPLERAELAGLGCVLGIGAGSLLQFAWSWAGGPLGRGFSLGLCVGGIVLSVVAWRITRRRLRSTQGPAAPELNDPAPAADPGANLARGCAAMVIAIFLFCVIQALLTPQKFWDERAYYGLKAIVLFEDATIHSADLLEPDFVQGHPRYPLMLSLAEQHIYALLGRVDDRLSKILFPLLYLGMVLNLAGILMRHRPPGIAWLGALLLATIPVLMPDDYGFSSGQADAPIACLEGLALFYLWDTLTVLHAPSRAGSWKTSLVLASVMTSLAAFTKDEGISHAIVHTIGFLMALSAGMLAVRRTGTMRPALPGDLPGTTGWQTGLYAILILVIVPSLLLAPWFLHRRHLPLTGEMNYAGRLSVESFVNGLSTLGWSLPHLAFRMFGEAARWGLQWWFAALALLLFPTRAMRPPQLFLLFTLLGDLAALLVAGMIAPVTLEEHIGGSSHRYLMQLAPAALLYALGQLHESPGVSPSVQS